MSVKVYIEEPTVSVTVTAPAVPVILGQPIVTQYTDAPPYYGEYEVTPADEAQTLATAGKRLAYDVTVNPIPSNYGKITWNGSVLTVS